MFGAQVYYVNRKQKHILLVQARPCFVWQNIDLWGGPRTTEDTVMDGQQIEDFFLFSTGFLVIRCSSLLIDNYSQVMQQL
jgi:hypothetical protein